MGAGFSLCASKHISDLAAGYWTSLLEGEDFLPVVFHADDDPRLMVLSTGLFRMA
jgi:hypothetical protein